MQSVYDAELAPRLGIAIGGNRHRHRHTAQAQAQAQAQKQTQTHAQTYRGWCSDTDVWRAPAAADSSSCTNCRANSCGISAGLKCTLKFTVSSFISWFVLLVFVRPLIDSCYYHVVQSCTLLFLLHCMPNDMLAVSLSCPSPFLLE
jgi:hypothetical protein